MLHSIFKSRAVKYFTPLVLLLTAFSLASKAGGDSYEIYINSKLIVQQVRMGVEVENLQLSKANYNDELVIRYNHCGRTGKGRSIALRDEKNNIVKEWKFADGSASMTVAVKEILELQKKNANTTLSLYYFSSQYLPKGRMLTSVKLQDKNTVTNTNKKSVSVS
jgi:hypothetical protein